MRFMMMFKPNEPLAPGESPCKQNLPEMAKLIGELKSTGVLLATEGLLPSDSGARVKLSRGKLAVTDGPFAEAKELVAGFAIVQVAGRAEAVEICKQFLTIAGGGEGDVLEVIEPAAK